MNKVPSMDEWLCEAEREAVSENIGMFLFHVGKVRRTDREFARGRSEVSHEVYGMEFSYDTELVDAAVRETYQLEGIGYVRVWLAEGRLSVGDDIMRVLVGGDIRPNVINALQFLVGRIKDRCVTEKELFSESE